MSRVTCNISQQFLFTFVGYLCVIISCNRRDFVHHSEKTLVKHRNKIYLFE